MKKEEPTRSPPPPPRPGVPPPPLQSKELPYPLWCRLLHNQTLEPLDIDLSDRIEFQNYIRASQDPSLVQFQYNTCVINFGCSDFMEQNNERFEIFRIEWFYDSTDPKNGINNPFMPYSYEISCKLEDAYKSDLPGVTVSDKPFREVKFEKTNSEHK